ncbi:hypothetical protein RHA1_ro00155 [Rhodococcus jostii RHA1]|uniref:Uncharacterized protein n=1 Tax=Rhodococcus jostii (strain RHA1) TaxID=101510 RepID=Q0SKE5_RHOJR|nr:hypothetical protein RHA1_ro00155 [Rhodococcus jostii RHA1]
MSNQYRCRSLIFARRQPAQMHGAFAVVEHSDRLAQRVPGIVELRAIGDLSRESIEPTCRQPKSNPWVPTDVPHPAGDEIRARHRQRGWQKRDEVGTVTALDHPHTLSSLFARLASSRRQYCKSRRRAHEEAGQHQGTEDCPVPRPPHQAPVLGRLLRRRSADLPVPLVIIRRGRSILVSCHSHRPVPAFPASNMATVHRSTRRHFTCQATKNRAPCRSSGS